MNQIELHDGKLTLKGNLTLGSVRPLFEQSRQLSNIDCVDVTAVEKVDSAGLALLILLYHQQASHPDKVFLKNPSDSLGELITLTNTDFLLEISVGELRKNKVTV